MKKMKKFFVVALAALAFTACNNDDDVNDGGKTNVIEGDAYISLKLRATATTRALNDPDQEGGTVDESTITDAIVLLFDGFLTTSKLVAAVDLEANDDEIGLPGQPTGLSGAAVRVPDTSKSILVVTNPSNIFRTRVAGLTNLATYADVNNVIALSLGSNSATVKSVIGNSGNYFMMSNAKGDLEPSDDFGNPKDIVLYPSSTEAESNPIAIYIDRVVAKVRVYSNAENYEAPMEVRSTRITEGDEPTEPIVANVEWLLNVTNQKYFPASKRTKTYREINNRSNGVWSDRYGIGSYRVDPNYDTNPTWPSVNYDANYHYFTEATTPSDWNAPGDTEYCLENTQTKTYNYHAYTTQVLIKANYAPHIFKDCSWNDQNKTWEDFYSYNKIAKLDWFRIDGVNYNESTLRNWIMRELYVKYYSGNTDDYTTTITTALNNYLTDIGSTDLLTIYTAAEFEALVTTQGASFEDRFDALLANFFNEYDEAMVAIFTYGSHAADKVTFYAEGVNYYKIMIKHDDDILPSIMNELGEFGVVRNSVYDITINKILKSGYPVIPDPDPTTPDEKEDTDQYISFKININPWTWYSQSEDL